MVGWLIPDPRRGLSVSIRASIDTLIQPFEAITYVGPPGERLDLPLSAGEIS